MTTQNRRNFLIQASTITLASGLSTIPTISFAKSHTGAGMTIIIGGREIEIIIPFFPEMPPKGETVEIGIKARSEGKSINRKARISSKAFVQFAKVLEKGGQVKYSAGGERLLGNFKVSDMGAVTGTVATSEGMEGEVQANAMAAGAAVAIIAIVAIVAVVAILAKSGGSVSATADTPVGSASVDIEVGGGDEE